MKTDITAVFGTMGERYERILEWYYPAHESTGFTERNLSVNFGVAFEKHYPESIIWYEAPFTGAEKESNHFDAVIFNPVHKELFIIESKRFSNPALKIDSVASDIRRIADKQHQEFVSVNFEGFNNSDWTKYGVIIADVWMEGEVKKNIFNAWDSVFRTQIIEDYKIEAVTVIETHTKDLQCKRKAYEKTIGKYKLLLGVFGFIL